MDVPGERFAAPVVKPQEGQQVIDTGPYAIVRHQMYASALLLGSWIGLGFSVLFIIGIAWRAVHEERALCQNMRGYRDYTAGVRYRFIPFVW